MQSKLARRFLVESNWKTFLSQIAAIVEADLRKLMHDPIEIVMRMIQPVLWLLLFGETMARVNPLPSSYLDYIAPGVLAQSVLFVSIFYGIALIWERDQGILHKIMVTPAPRVTLVIGRSIGAGIRSLFQALIIYLLAIVLGIHLNFSPLNLLGVMSMVMLIAATFSTFSLLVATVVKKRDRFLGIGQLLTMPFFFASNALYPIESMPTWIRHLSTVNPLSYHVDALRTMMIQGEVAHYGLLFDFSVSFAIFCVLVAFATMRYPKILY